MRNTRMTVLMTPEEKAGVEAQAARLGISGGEYVRLAVDNFDRASAGEEAEVAVLVEQANVAIPKMAAAIERMIDKLDETHVEVDRMLREAGVRR